ncbi:hypothetical protein ACNTMW_14025 [Planosporangium sp. 12N6]
MGSMLFAVCAVAAQLDRDYIREKTLDGQRSAAARGNHGGHPKVIDDDSFLRHSSKPPRYRVPATRLVRSSWISRLLTGVRGTSPSQIRCASPSTT